MGGANSNATAVGTNVQWHAAAALQLGEPRVRQWRVVAIEAWTVFVGPATQKQLAASICVGAGLTTWLVCFV